MARTFEIKRLLSTAGTGYSYIVKRGTKGDKKEKLEVKKFDPVAKKHVLFKEAKLPNPKKQ
ncbi:MAG: 50S ribosomal protein L33 [Pelagibacteraceae bacterium]|nr:50S ribosomal protein L33 [Pelagibacteraceae bacterium]PPR32689.1 MAG: 50S ribosomal protein L33 [Alphaproteobacteria bacterium MarineAlpha6_Bin5]|tara:strand:- start:312 stop:494 length:183 start_codon:yes stop_codon:yes gene_type:complete